MCAMVLCIPASANTSVWILSNQAEADIVTGNGQITITLIDKVINPTAVTSNLSAFIFTTSNAPTSESILSGTGYERTITGTGAGQYTESVNLVAAGWAISLVSATTTLDVLAAGGAGPAHTILGAPDAGNAYSNANGSLTSGPHNPFLDGSATFILSAAGVTSATTITASTFQFGTADGSNRFAGTLVATPEPATYFTLCGGLLLMLGTRRAAQKRHS